MDSDTSRRGYHTNRARQLRRPDGVWAPHATTGQVHAAAQHLDTLREAGIGARTVAAEAGLSATTVAAVRNGRRVRTSTANKVAAAHPSPAPGALVDVARARSLVAALLDAGWTVQEIAVVLDVHPTTLRFRSKRCTARLTERLEAFVELLGAVVVGDAVLEAPLPPHAFAAIEEHITSP